MAKLSEAEIDAAKAQAPSATKISMLDGALEVMVRRPTRQEWKAYRQAGFHPDPAKQSGAGEQLFLACCLVPDKAHVMEMLEEFPAIVESSTPILAKMAGFDLKAEATF